MTRRVSIALGAVCIALAASATPAAAQTIQGTVINTSKAALPNVSVIAYTSTGGFVSSAITNGSGFYSISGLTGGSSYYLATSNSDFYINVAYPNVPCVSNCAPTFAGPIAGTTAVTAPLSGSVTANTIVMAPGAELDGVVTGNKIGVAGFVTLYNSTGAFQGSVSTSTPSGVYTFPMGIPNGTYHLVTGNSVGFIDQVYSGVSCPMGFCSATSGTPITISTSGAQTDRNFTLSPGARIAGVIEAQGDPVSSGSVSIYNSVGNFVGSAFVDENGAYSSSGLPTGQYFVKAFSGSFIPQLHSGINCPNCSVTSGNGLSLVAPAPPNAPTTTTVNFDLELGGTISGTVLNASAPVSGSNVQIYDASGAFVTSAQTNGSGLYTVGGLLSGQYFVKANPPGATGSSSLVARLYNGFDCPSCDVSTGTLVTVTQPGTTSGINFSMTTGGTISGTVTGPSGNVAGLQMTVLNSAGNTVGTVTTNGSGVYTYNGLLAGTYYVRTSTTTPGGLIPEIYKGPGNHETCYSCSYLAGLGVAVTNGNTSTANFSLLAGGTISGTVTNSSTSAALQGVTVSLFNSVNFSSLLTKLTDASGNFSFTGLPSGTYFLRTSNTLGVVDEVFDNINCLGCTASGGTPILLTAPNTIGSRNFALAPGGRISGRITDAIRGTGIGGSGTTSVRVFNSAGTQVTTGTTDTGGNYTTASGLTTGNYYVMSSNSLGYIDTLFDGIGCFGCSAVSGTPVAVVQGSTTPNVDLALAVGGQLTGTVRRASDSSPIPYAGVQIYSSAGTSLQFASANSLGQYAFAGLPTGTYYVRTSTSYLGFIDELFNDIPCANCAVTTGELINVTAGATTSGINFSLLTGATISGTVTDFSTAGPIANVFVNVYNASNSFVASATTAPDGTYIVKGLPTGSYYLQTSNSLNYINQVFATPPVDCFNCSANTGTPVAVVVGTTNATGKNFALKTGGRLTGRVTDGTNGLGGVSLTLYSSTGQFVSSTSTDASGNYVFAGLSTSSYLVRTSNSLGFIDQVYNGLECLACTPTTGTAVLVTQPGTTSNINFVLAPGGRIRGTVTDTAGNPLTGITVQIFKSTGGGSVTTATSGATGAWVSNAGLPAGTYVARTSNSQGYIDKLYDGVQCLGCSVVSGTQIVIGAGAPTVVGVDFSLEVGGSIAGVITASAGDAPIQGVFAQVYTSAGTFVTSSSSNGSGGFVLRGLPAGQYFVRTSNSLGYIDRLFNGFTSLGSAVTAGTPVTVVVGSTTAGVDFSLDAGNRITGVVRSTETGNPPIGGVSVQVYTSSGAFVSSATTSPSGTYVVGGLPAGNYYARTFNSLGYVNMLFPAIPCQSCSVTAGTLIPVPAGGAGTANFMLPVGGSIAGTVSNGGAGVAPGEASVSVYTTQGSFVGSASVSGAGGAYLVTGLPTGNYVARTTNIIGLVDQQYAGVPCLGCTFASGTPIAVTVGATRSGINFSLAPGGRISGTVRDASTSAPLAGVTVQIYSESNGFVTSASTDNTGGYRTLAGVPDGTYYARTVGANGYIGMLYSGVACLNCAPNSGTPIAVSGTGGASGIDFNLTLGGRITGRVTDAASNPLQGITVTVYQPSGAFVASGTTNFDGSYTTQGMPTGTYYLRTNNGQGYINQLYAGVLCVRCSVTAGAPVSVTMGATTPNINFALSAGGRISGTVIDAATSQPVGGISLQVYDASGVVVTTAFTNNVGTYISGAGLVAGTYYVKANNTLGYVNQVYTAVACAVCDPRTGTPVSVTTGATTPNINFALTMGGRITGTITGTRKDPGTGLDVTGPLADVEVDVFTSTGGFATFAVTGTDGRFITAAGLPTGNYFLTTYNQSGYIDQLYVFNSNTGVAVPTPCGTNCAITSGTPVPVVLGSTTSGKDFALVQGGRIEGRITKQSGGAAISGVLVFVYDSAGTPAAFGMTDGTGRYVSDSGLPSGTYYVGTRNRVGLVDRVYSTLDCAGCVVTGGQAIPVTAGNTASGIDIALGGGELLTGMVTDAATGLPLAGALVRVLSSTGTFVTSAITDESGNYTTLSAVPAGTYFVRTMNALGYIDRVYDTGICLACDVTRATPVVVDGVGTTSGLNFALAQGGRFSGTVVGRRDPAAPLLPVPGVKVRVFNSAGSLIGETISNGIGQYTSPGLPPGNYYVRTYNPSGLIDEIYNDVPCTPCTIAQGTPVTVVTGGLRTGVDFSLEGGGIVSGYVIDQATGAPIAGVTVAIYVAGTNTLVANTDATNLNGYYQISLPVGSYDVEPNPVPGYRPFVPVSLRGSSARSNVNVDTGTETTGVGFALVACAPITVNPVLLPLATQGQLFSSVLTATGGTAPYTFAITDGTPNTGLALASSGLLAGAPVFAGTGNFTIAAVDANSCAGGRAFALTACSFFLSTSSLSTTANAGSASVDLTSSALDCPWVVTTPDAWITVTSAASGVGNGTVTFSFAFNGTGASRSGTLRIGGQVFTVTQATPTSTPAFGVVDTPLAGATGISGSMAVTGWALDDIEVKRVVISRDAVAAEGGVGEVYLGDATMVEGARPDVAATNPTLPFKTRAGWGYLLLTNMLPNQGTGTFVLHMDAIDAEGSTTRLGSRTFVGDNANAILPFGAIDTPGQGATISGTSFVNFGWALTPQPKSIPIDGSTITVYVDGVPAGHPTYNNFRPDVAGLFPGLANTGGAVGFRVFDTTTWTNGVHTIAWVVSDSGGQAEGIGSRYFTVNNVLASVRFAPTLASMRASAVTAGAPEPAVDARLGFDRLQPALELRADASGGRSVAVGQLSRLELRFGRACGAITGAQLVAGERKPLPIGSTLDPSGAFAWMPGPAFLGTYQLEFTVPSCGGGESTIPVTVAVVAGR